MKKRLYQAPIETPVSLDEAKIHLGITDSSRDALISGLIGAATALVESFTKRRFVSQGWELVLSGGFSRIKIPFGNLQSVDSISYVDSAGTGYTVQSSDYYVSGIGTDKGELFILDTFSFPALYDYDPVVIRFVCGYGGQALTPDVFKNAIKLSIEDMFYGGDGKTDTVKALIWPFRNWWGEYGKKTV